MKKVKNIRTNKIEFFQNGKQVFPISINGNIATFKNGKTILL